MSCGHRDESIGFTPLQRRSNSTEIDFEALGA
jgi:hypothetical protein